MRSYLPSYHMEAPRDLAAALERMAREPGVWKPFAGGTDLMVLLEAGKLPHRRFLSIWKLPELRGIEVTARPRDDRRTHNLHGRAAARKAFARVSASVLTPLLKLAASPRRIAERSAEILPTLRPRRIRRPR